ncbi:hypothetical protein OAO01_07575 [Oligoflexia bacterium]|nr:hypothetical protein [Oligoflexia bacterium]
MNQKVFELAAVNTAPLGLVIEGQKERFSAGHQYLFVIIPFGRVVIEDPSKYLERSAYTKLALLGYKPLVNSTGTRHKTLQIRIDSLQASAFDFLFFRRVVARVSLGASLKDGLGNEIAEVTADASHASVRKYGFHTELEYALDKSFSAALSDLFEQLGLGAVADI